MSDATTKEEWVVKFQPFSSSVDAPFWVRYCHEKLETIRLNTDPIPIEASYGIDHDEGKKSNSSSGGGGGVPRLQCQESSLRMNNTNNNDNSTTTASSSSVPNERVAVSTTLLGFNTLETFQKIDKNQVLIDNFIPKFLSLSSSSSKETSCLTSAVVLTFPDLKNHKVLYWFGIPALLTQSGHPIRAIGSCQSLRTIWSKDNYQLLTVQINTLRRQQQQQQNQQTGLFPFFVRTKDKCELLDFETLQRLGLTTNDSFPNDDIVFGFFDPTTTSSSTEQQIMGWPMRNLIAYLSFHLNLGGKVVKILSYRPKYVRRLLQSEEEDITIIVDCNFDDDKSILLNVIVPNKEDYEWPAKDGQDTTKKIYKVVGWELNARGKPGPRWVNLRPLLDSKHLAIQAADLNLKLMKWRMIPNLNVTLLQSTKVLLVGAGTLGCSVARTLLGWGIRKMTILDYGNVSYSNPVRQNLFTLNDCQPKQEQKGKEQQEQEQRAPGGGGRSKSIAASDALQAIAADVESEGKILSIPMPGHAETKESIKETVLTLDALVQESDVVFLLTDTRESRWLPTIMAAAHDKMLINAALGLDSWLVMRHGGGGIDSTNDDGIKKSSRLGCYFCNDVVAPENSTKNRTLDQQCTVTRPGLAPIASSMAVELMVSCLHHPLKHNAPAPGNPSSGNNYAPGGDDSTNNIESPLGIMPHQIRGSLVSYTMMTPTVPAFQYCTGCSIPTIEAYQKDKLELVYQVCQSQDGSYLETLSGLQAFRAEATKFEENDIDVEDEDWEL